MNLTLEELVILTQSQKPKKPSVLAANAMGYLANPRFDQPVMLTKVSDLIQGGYLDKNKDGTVELSRRGWGEVLSASQFLEQLRGDLAMTMYRVVR